MTEEKLIREKGKIWAGKKVLVVGMARSGLAAAELLHEVGAEVTVNDGKPEEEFA